MLKQGAGSGPGPGGPIRGDRGLYGPFPTRSVSEAPIQAATIMQAPLSLRISRYLVFHRSTVVILIFADEAGGTPAALVIHSEHPWASAAPRQSQVPSGAA